jgi:hypothetical protein
MELDSATPASEQSAIGSAVPSLDDDEGKETIETINTKKN